MMLQERRCYGIDESAFMTAPSRESVSRSWAHPLRLGQFGLRHLLGCITAICVLLGVAVLVGPSGWQLFGWAGWLVLVVFSSANLIVVAALTIGVVYGRGEVRPFCIGALFPTGVLAARFAIGSGMFGRGLPIVEGMASYVVAFISGYCCVRVYRYLQQELPAGP